MRFSLIVGALTVVDRGGYRSMSKIYIMRVNCIGFHDYAVRADSKKAAENKAVAMFQCDGTEGEVGEHLNVGDTWMTEAELKHAVNGNNGSIEL